jgi:hypothetical protein
LKLLISLTKKSGVGILTKKNGEKIEQFWSNGKLIKELPVVDIIASSTGL